MFTLVLRILTSLCNWEDDGDCPKVDRKWKRTVDEAAMKISTRIAQAIDGWQRENRILQGIDNEIVNQFAKEFGLLNHHVEDIESRKISSVFYSFPTVYIITTKKWLEIFIYSQIYHYTST